MLDDLLDGNRRFASGFGGGDRPKLPRRRLAVLTCMDCRLEPLASLGLEPGDAVVVRNAGGRASDDALRSLGLACRLLDTKEVVVVHHTDCALAGQTEAALRDRLEQAGAADAGRWAYLAMPDPDVALREDVERVRAFPLITEGVTVAGWRYDVSTGEVASVVPADPQ